VRRRSIDEVYAMVEFDCNAAHVEQALQVLNAAVGDFSEVRRCGTLQRGFRCVLVCGSASVPG
jgi:hypothetical protein